MATEVERARRLFTIDEYEQMVEKGILRRDERVELIDGEIIEMSPIGDPHASCVANLNQELVLRVDRRAVVWPQGPVRIPKWSMPQPDIALLRLRTYRTAGPEPADVMLVVEVSDTTLRFDRTRKLRLYARAGIQDYWIADTNAMAVELYRDPGGEAYRDRLVVSSDGTVSPLAFPDVVIRVADLFA